MVADSTTDLRRRFTVEEYERMGDTGVLDPEERVELLEGEIVYMSPIGSKHAGVVNALVELLVGQLAGRANVIVQNPLRLLPRSEPQPDVLVARRRSDFYRGGHPTAEDVLLLIEVSDSSLRTDRAIKLPIYARQRIAEVWLIDLAARAVHVHTDPDGDDYRSVRTVRDGALTPVALADLTLRIPDMLGE
jgi:Uma2 family endonuclease